MSFAFGNTVTRMITAVMVDNPMVVTLTRSVCCEFLGMASPLVSVEFPVVVLKFLLVLLKCPIVLLIFLLVVGEFTVLVSMFLSESDLLNCSVSGLGCGCG